MLSLIAAFDRNKMKQTKTRVRTSNGEVYEEQLRNGHLESTFMGTEGRPAYLEDNINGYSAIIPGRYDAVMRKWTNYIYNDSSTITHTKSKISFITLNVWFYEWYLKERALAFFAELEKCKPDILIYTLLLAPSICILILLHLHSVLIHVPTLHCIITEYKIILVIIN